ncbi:hypothetical protein IAT40_005045 [Kwoniella sp. CBS 6097]
MSYYGQQPNQPPPGQWGPPPPGAPGGPPPGQWDPNQQVPPGMHNQYVPQNNMNPYQQSYDQSQQPPQQQDKGMGSNAACCGLGACCACCLSCCACCEICDALF